jgi:hypothetical protein
MQVRSERCAYSDTLACRPEREEDVLDHVLRHHARPDHTPRALAKLAMIEAEDRLEGYGVSQPHPLGEELLVAPFGEIYFSSRAICRPAASLDQIGICATQPNMDSRFRGNDVSVDSHLRGNDVSVDSHLRGNDGGMDSRSRGIDCECKSSFLFPVPRSLSRAVPEP